MPGNALERMREQLNAQDYKFTPQRSMVLQVLTEHPDEHLSADEIYARVKVKYPDIGMATIYRTLDLLTNLNIVNKVNFGDGKSRFEISQKERHQHHHLICLSCNEIIEVKDDLLIQLEKTITKEHDFEIIDHMVQFYGHCKKCSEKDNKTKNKPQ